MFTIHHLIRSVEDFYVFFSSLFVFALLCRLPYLLSFFTSISKATRKQPHLIFILADDLVSNFCRGKQFNQHFASLKFWEELHELHFLSCFYYLFIIYSLLYILRFTGMGWRWFSWFPPNSNSKYRRHGNWGRYIKQLLCVSDVYSD